MPRSSTSYKPGRSGNPLGRPKADFNLRDYARSFGRAAIISLAELAGLGDGPPAPNGAVRVAALRELLDRGYGKATTVLAGDDEMPPASIEFCWRPASSSQAAPAIDSVATRLANTVVEPDATDDVVVTWGSH